MMEMEDSVCAIGGGNGLSVRGLNKIEFLSEQERALIVVRICFMAILVKMSLPLILGGQS